MTDRNFDGIAERFKKNIYGNAKGELRLALCWRELCDKLPVLNNGQNLAVWDAGGGLGQMATRIATQGHSVLLNDISADMLTLAREDIETAGLGANIDIRHADIQSLATDKAHQSVFDLVLCHAVLEWVADPEVVISALVAGMKPGGYLSLMFYNVNALILSNMAKGNLYKLRDKAFSGHPGGLTPPSPRTPEQVIDLLQQAGVEVIAKRGIRLVYDLMPRAVRAERSLDDVLALEWQYGADEPFWALGRYVHLLCRLPQ
ncbi:tRNA 5-carboxymethoxyuridine methyltransferase [Zhongshania aliphaticivorans]|uniref:tRNA 5-carboxymethoxyuridine methyltransferase n=1 Tax=Zhongshania aliphaticivorans TaxID=1470434 RepID=A0A5S9ND49_9GAMM|nr:methyltransferase domain-containing protein [Zhongshania aliphaticivorans]CAA0079239.1 tRNA 5-carboxymethoxyuridine methyltransferase [Zhongshania aliphaticivorans]CAA0086300.1 tRNA 5-carboxymethoxyuridine methyltransferase [Zhongshania aliphaticivorans]